MTTDFQLRAALEALLLSAETPLNLVTMAGALEVPIGTVSAEIEALVLDYNQAHEGAGRGFELREVGDIEREAHECQLVAALRAHRGHVDLLARQGIADVAQQAAPVGGGHRHLDRVAVQVAAVRRLEGVRALDGAGEVGVVVARVKVEVVLDDRRALLDRDRRAVDRRHAGEARVDSRDLVGVHRRHLHDHVVRRRLVQQGGDVGSQLAE